jgi:cyclopropane fatty-acyl-phospholipid synthase-like methyltransferase
MQCSENRHLRKHAGPRLRLSGIRFVIVCEDGRLSSMQLPKAWSSLSGADIYLLDLVLRGVIPPDAKVLDIGCGSGSNLPFLAYAGATITAVDADPAAVASCSRSLAQAPGTHTCAVAARLRGVL